MDKGDSGKLIVTELTTPENKPSFRILLWTFSVFVFIFFPLHMVMDFFLTNCTHPSTSVQAI